jgi:hypothetical protein
MARKDRSSRRRPAALWVGVFLSLLPLTLACTDITRPTDQLSKPEMPRLNVSQGDGPKIGTDKQDYYPGETVVIDGWDWTAGETVRLQIVHVGEGDNELPEHQVWEVTADANGYISSSWMVPLEGDENGATLKLTADGVTSLAHAEVLFTDLTGTVNLFSDAGYTIAQTAFSWNATVRPRIIGPGKSTCYRITWTDPSGDVFYGFGETGDPPPPELNLPVRPTGTESGTWNVVVGQRAAGSCESQTSFSSPTNAIYFDVARSVIIGAGTSGTADSPGGDQCVYSNSNVGSFCQNPASVRMYVGRSSANQLRSYVRFDLTTASPAIPSGVIVTDAKVRLVAGGFAGGRDYAIQRGDAMWAEGTINYGGQPGTTGSATTVAMVASGVPGVGGGDPQTWMKWDVDADVQGFLNGTANHGWRISDVTAATSTANGMFFTTEATDGCAAGVTTCMRKWPVLLIDYVDPPKLLFYTPARSGIVGQCLGPIQLRSFEFNGTTPLPVTSDLTVNLSTANLGTGDIFATAGAGSFFSNGTCTTATTTATIPNGASISQAFYYRATHRGDGGHDVVASATGFTPNPSQTQTIDKAPTTTVYTGDLVLLAGNTFTLKAQLISPYAACQYNGNTTPYGRRVLFRIEDDPTDGTGYLGFPFTFTDASGAATRSTPTTGWLEGIYDVSANAVDNDDCDAWKDNAALAVLLPGNAATGGGFLAGNKVGGGRVNFGFNVRPIENSDPLAYKGQFLLIKQDGGVPLFRCKGYIDTYGEVPDTDPQRYAASGKCDFQLWDPALNGGWGDWYVPEGSGYTNQEFTIYFIDNGQGRGRDAPPPDKFGFTVGFVGPVIGDPTFPIAEINGGNIDAKAGSTTTTGTKGGGKKG